jgi:RNA polymerase sigma-70 factor (ECF subfamily)
MSETSTGLLLRVRDPGDHAAWSRLVTLYTPLLAAWVSRAAVPSQDAADMVQEILMAVAREMPNFEYDSSKGSFRGWLRTILSHRVLNYRRASHSMPTQPVDEDLLQKLADPTSDLSRAWEEEHDRHVVARLLETVRPEFGDSVWQAFVQVVLDGERPCEVAASLGMSIESVYQARSRVVACLRKHAGGLLD